MKIRRRKRRVERKNRLSFFILSVAGVHPLFQNVQIQPTPTLYEIISFLNQVFFYLSRYQMLRVLIPTQSLLLLI